jgi:hypothetical protein
VAENENAAIPATAAGHGRPVDRGDASPASIATVWPSARLASILPGLDATRLGWDDEGHTERA